MGFVIPTSYQHEHFRTVEEIITKDKGSMIFSPQIGLHENVVVLDYENEYANLILRHNLSYETETGKERWQNYAEHKCQGTPTSNRTGKGSQGTNIFQEFTENIRY